MKKLFVVGIGPGGAEEMTFRAHKTLQNTDIIVGYSKYIELIKPVFPDKATYQTGMTKEIDRCREALQMAQDGKIVALVCSGDAGVYGLAGLTLELAVDYPQVHVEIVPGITAAQSGAARLGAPLTHDFAVISLSDLMTPWAQIEKRLDCAATGDFCIALYNPSSIKRVDYLKKACDILLVHKSPTTICGYVKNIGREGELTKILTLEELKNEAVDMFTTVFVGNNETKVIDDKMVTPRGYRIV